MNTLRNILAGGVALAALVLLAAPQAEARPQYMKQFPKQYPALQAEAKMNKCGVCHYGKSKKNLDDYGSALKGKLGKKNEKDVEKITEALEAIESMDSSVEGKTFGDLIEEGKLPGTDPEE
ncbi:hypothetical protein [Stratiformator vulcanicus]|uniref:Cytochrome c domain-containing protein n=1 Tax=Stratiformator vulcanicus TaxID=2527980 RepID=A0A517QWE4_9PLAN|nr:hypothetical protein [Stratiformator vulcanicus]QDT35924.1 hypothetical protein Pan189_02770 [Stratiformator vulcanicus]